MKVFFIGMMGSGKTTLLNIIGLLDGVTRGKVYIDGEDTTKLSDDELSKLRGEKIGFIFQSFFLLPGLTAQENVAEGSQNPQNTTGTTVFFNSDGGEMKSDGTATTADYGTLDDGDILGIALDMDAGSYGQITIYDNGSAIVSNYDLVSSSTLVMPFASIGATAEYNFGSPSFSISSGNADANGYGNFEYSVPSNYFSLCTKNLADYG